MFKLLVALDFDSQSKAYSLVDQLDSNYCGLKVGSEMYTLLGPSFVTSLIQRGFKVFLDLKFYDIPNTVARATKVAADLGVWMLNVHASGGLSMMQAARDALVPYSSSRPYLIAVTLLTSISATDLLTVGITASLESQVLRLAQLSCDAGLDGVVCSAWEVPSIKGLCGQDFLTITPGIRLPNSMKDDQTRIVTPELAMKAGSDFWVVGRPITTAANPMDVVHELLRYG